MRWHSHRRHNLAIAPPLGLRYLLVSGTCFVSNNLILIVADALSLPILVGVAAAFVIVGAIGFQLHCRFTFLTPPSWGGFGRFLGVMAVNTPLSIALLWIVARWLAWPMIVAAPVASVAMVAVNFFATRWVIVSDRGR